MNKIKDTFIEGDKEITHYLNGRIRVRTINEEPTKTDQTQKEQCDINNIMKRYNKKIQNVDSPILEKYAGSFFDSSQKPTYQTALNTLIEARNTFENLPSHLRKKFGNDPANMISYLQDSSNNEEAQKLGLKIKPPEQKQTEAEKYYANQNAKNKKASTTPSTGNTDSDD